MRDAGIDILGKFPIIIANKVPLIGSKRLLSESGPKKIALASFEWAI